MWRIFLLSICISNTIRGQDSIWSWECHENFCQKVSVKDTKIDNIVSLPVCRLLCSESAALWPKPTGQTKISKNLVKINHTPEPCINTNPASADILKVMTNTFKKKLLNTITDDDAKLLEITCEIAHPDITELQLDIDEGYTLKITEATDKIIASISSDNIFGFRHGLETLFQLIVYDDLRNHHVIPNEATIIDKPAYSYRGVSLDTSRHFISVEAIRRTIQGMAASKLNTLHWHLTDTHSFPFVSESLPDLSKYGAYSPLQVYTPEEVSELVRFGLENGVRVVPEFDAPAHVGEGWQNTGLVVCFNSKPWQDYCVQPPCGQFDPTKEELYETLEKLYGDMVKQFQPVLFHMGGDEVHFGCWNSTSSIVEWMKNEKGWENDEPGFIQLWTLFQNESEARLIKHLDKEIPIILWSSTLTHQDYLHYLPKEKYIIQVWTQINDTQVATLLENDYRIILSNYDALYLDCGFGGWVDEGNNWCSPYKGWQKFYQNKPGQIAGNKKHLIVGAEAVLWTEQADSGTIDNRIWPRAAALAEVLWSEPEIEWRDAESRMLVQRERLVALGINADRLQPEWCMHHEENCPIDGKFNRKTSSFSSRSATASIVIIVKCLFYVFAGYFIL